MVSNVILFTVSGDVNIVIYKPRTGLHYCIVPQSYASHQRLVPRLGNCCQRNRLVFMYDRIQDESGSHCLVEITNTDWQFKLGRTTDGMLIVCGVADHLLRNKKRGKGLKFLPLTLFTHFLPLFLYHHYHHHGGN